MRVINKLINTIISVSIKLIVYALVLLLLVRGSFMAYHFGYDIFGNRNDIIGKGSVSLDIAEGSSELDIAEVLKEKGIISNIYSFVAQSKLFDYDIKAGHYEIEEGKSVREILELLNSGTSKKESK